MTNGRITNQDLSRQIQNLKDYIQECNKRNEKTIEQNRIDLNKNTVAIAGIKGASGVIALIVTAIMNVIITLGFKGIHQ